MQGEDTYVGVMVMVMVTHADAGFRDGWMCKR